MFVGCSQQETPSQANPVAQAPTPTLAVEPAQTNEAPQEAQLTVDDFLDAVKAKKSQAQKVKQS